MRIKKQKGFMDIRKIFSFAKQNYFITIITLCILFVGVVSVYKLFFSKPTYVYVRVKVSQGLWWASTQRPSWWFVKAVKPGMVQKDLTGKPIVQILSVRYYPYYGGGQYDIYVDLKLKVTANKSTGEYNFNRSTIGVSSAIDLEFPSTQFSGTIIDIAPNPLIENYQENVITLQKKNAYPWEYDALKIGDTYFDGQNTVFEILGKNKIDTTSSSLDSAPNGWSYLSPINIPTKYIEVTAKIKTKKDGSQLIFGEEQIVAPGKTISIATPNFTFNDFVVAKVE